MSNNLISVDDLDVAFIVAGYKIRSGYTSVLDQALNRPMSIHYVYVNILGLHGAAKKSTNT